jgi:hypothetical protein
MRTVRKLAAWTFGTCLVLAVCAGVPVVRAQTDDTDGGGKGLQGVLEKVGAEYAKAYLSPMTQTFGVNQNSGLYTTAAIPTARLTFQFGVKMMDTRIATEDQFFHRSMNVTLNETWGITPSSPYYGEQGTVELGGPTCFGPKESDNNDGDQPDPNDGYIRAYHDGVLVGEQRTMAGVLKTRDVPLAMPEVSVGGIYGVRATLRWLPTIKAGDDIGKIKLFGFGLQGNVNQFLPMVPVDVMVGFFHQTFKVGSVVETNATSVFLAASKSYSLVTLYGGVARESSTFKVHYTYNPDVETGLSPANVSFEEKGKQHGRLTLGASLNLGVRLNADVNFGSTLTSYSAGLMFGI